MHPPQRLYQYVAQRYDLRTRRSSTRPAPSRFGSLVTGFAGTDPGDLFLSTQGTRDNPTMKGGRRWPVGTE